MLLYILLVVIALLVTINLYLFFNGKPAKDPDLYFRLDAFSKEINRIEDAVKKEIASNRKETFDNAVEARRELSHTLDLFRKDFSKSVADFTSLQSENFHALLRKQTEQNTNTGNSLNDMRQTIEQKITNLQQGNEQKLEQMRLTVDEKLQKTLEARLGESFKLVSERLEAVHKGLGDMQQLATGVGDLKRVLTNVKTRGVLGEYQLENILEQTLTPEQYAKNVKTKEGSNAMVEFAVKLPGNNDKPVWLPIDSKFPKEDFELLLQAYDQDDVAQIEDRRKSFVRGIKKSAADICDRYIDSPNTTDFAILFLPFESLYAEVLRTPGLFEGIRTECKINIAGPTTLSAFLSSLQMGFHTLAIEKRSSEVWQILSAVKTEFGNFSTLLHKAKNNIQTGLNQLDDLSEKRTRAIEKRLKNVNAVTDQVVQHNIPELTGGEMPEPNE